jgi:hypothetical protein
MMTMMTKTMTRLPVEGDPHQALRRRQRRQQMMTMMTKTMTPCLGPGLDPCRQQMMTMMIKMTTRLPGEGGPNLLWK